MYSKHPNSDSNIPYDQYQIKKDTQIDDTTQRRSIQKQQQCINISNNKYGRSLRQDTSYDNYSNEMMNKTMTMPYPPPPYHMVGGHHPYPTHQYHHPYHMSHHTSKPIYSQPATTATNNASANSKQTAKLQYRSDTTSKQQQEKAASSSMTHHMSQYHLPPPTHYAYPYPYSYMPHNAQASAAAYQYQYMTSKVSEDQMAALPIKHDGRRR